MTSAYYNEIDPIAAAWLRNLITAGHIAPGDVDERSIEDVRPDDLRGYTQCHFFAGIGVWSYALRRAGWDDTRPVWTGSCPCQPFSAAGKGKGFADERHLWPAWFHLIANGKRSDVPVFGEQVASKDGLAWVDLVQTDLEAADHTLGILDACSAGFGAPHIRQRLFWVAYALPTGRAEGRTGAGNGQAAGSSPAGRLGNTDGARSPARLPEPQERQEGLAEIHDNGSGGLLRPGEGRSAVGGLAVTYNAKRRTEATGRNNGDRQDTGRPQGSSHPEGRCSDGRPSPTNGFWGSADWLYCRDGKWRPVEPGTFPLAHGAPARVGRLRAYGNAINAEQAAEFVRAADQILDVIDLIM